ncbi:AAA family ATPase [Cupriavidus alkaliphilus]|uniref:AAA family ATPase n=1 Tax=Cupriavidus alkaliphilus TaxID=942866 RepID=UPI00339D41C0
MYILITGAAGSGTSTLANALGEATHARVLETDDYFWRPTDPPYQQKFGAEERCSLLLNDLRTSPDAVVAGALIDWGQELENAFDFVVFLYLPTAIRLARLKLREERRFGQADPEFLAWAAQYDAGTAEGRSLERHRQWMKKLNCPVLCLESDESVEIRLQSVLAVRNAIIQGSRSH